MEQKEKEVTCPVCEEKFILEEDVEEGDLINCPVCDAELVIKSLEPVKFEVSEFDAFDIDLEEDYDDPSWEEEEFDEYEDWE